MVKRWLTLGPVRGTPPGSGGATIYRSPFLSRPTIFLKGDAWFNNDRGSRLHAIASQNGVWADYWANEPVVLPPSTGWSWDNEETGDEVDFSSGTMRFVALRTAIGEHTLQYRPAPNPPYAIEALILHDVSGLDTIVSTGGRDANVGIYFRDGSGKLIYFGLGAFDNTPSVRVQYWNNNNSLNSNQLQANDNSGGALYDFLFRNPTALKIEDDGVSSLRFYWAFSDGDWVEFGSGLGRTAFLSSGPSQFGVGGYKGDGTIRLNLVSLRETMPAVGSGARLFVNGIDTIDWGEHSAHAITGDLSIGLWLKVSSSTQDNDLLIHRGHGSGGVITFYQLRLRTAPSKWSIRYHHDNASDQPATIDFAAGLAENQWIYVGISRKVSSQRVNLFIGDADSIHTIIEGSWSGQPDPGGSDSGSRNLFVGGGDLDAIVQDQYVAAADWTTTDHRQASLGNPPGSGLVLSIGVLGSNPETDNSAVGAAGSVTGTVVVEGRP